MHLCFICQECVALASALHLYGLIFSKPFVHCLQLIFICQPLVMLSFSSFSLSLSVSPWLSLHPHAPSFACCLSRSAILHDMSEDAFEHCTPVMVLSPARKESGRESVKQKPRRRRRASERYEHAEEHRRGRRSDFNLQISSPRWRELYTDATDSSSSDESHWMQAKRRAQVKFRLSRRRRRTSNKPCGNLDASSSPHQVELVDLGSKSKRQPELRECENCSLNLRRGKVVRYQECGRALAGGPCEMKRSSQTHEESKGRSLHRDLRLLPGLRRNETTKKRCPETEPSAEILAVAEGGKCVGDRGLPVHHSLHKPPATGDDGAGNLEVCRSVTVEKAPCPPLSQVCVCHLPSTCRTYSCCCLSDWV